MILEPTKTALKGIAKIKNLVFSSLDYLLEEIYYLGKSQLYFYYFFLNRLFFYVFKKSSLEGKFIYADLKFYEHET